MYHNAYNGTNFILFTLFFVLWPNLLIIVVLFHLYQHQSLGLHCGDHNLLISYFFAVCLTWISSWKLSEHDINKQRCGFLFTMNVRRSLITRNGIIVVFWRIGPWKFFVIDREKENNNKRKQKTKTEPPKTCHERKTLIVHIHQRKSF